jgi:hypothetical protein
MHKKFAVKFLLIVILIGPIGQFLLFKFTPLYDLNLFSKLYDETAWVKGDPKILIMGSSHAKYQIIPADIAKLNAGYLKSDIVNIAENSASPFHMYHAYMKGKHKFSNLEKVYYTLEPHILGEKYNLYLKYEKRNISYAQWQYFEKHNVSNGYFYPSQQFVESLTFSIADRSLSNGYIAKGHQDFLPFSRGKVANQVFDDLELFPVSDFQMHYLSLLVNELRYSNVALYFVLTPTYSWHTFYRQEAVEYDAQLIAKLNYYLGDSAVIGSMWPEDYGLEYIDFYDDTHISHTGAQKFSRKLFADIESHEKIIAIPFKHTFNYREARGDENNVKSSHYKASSLPWIHTKDVVKTKSGDQVCFSSKEVDASMLMTTRFSLITHVSEVKVNFFNAGPQFLKLAVTLRKGDQYGHFFLQPKEYESDVFLLKPIDVDKFSEGFDFTEIDSFSLRVYPLKEGVEGFCLSSIEFG